MKCLKIFINKYINKYFKTILVESKQIIRFGSSIIYVYII
uniref:Uncharacterized protein n=1 Tax=viral metagenome TaxID=1070528 RepID=A0A6C0H9J2_9ZZZZ